MVFLTAPESLRTGDVAQPVDVETPAFNQFRDGHRGSSFSKCQLVLEHFGLL